MPVITGLFAKDAPDWNSYAGKAQQYLSRPVFQGTPLTGKTLASSAKKAYEKTGRIIPLELALSQAQFETSMARKGRNPATNPFNVGEFDKGTKIRFKTLQEGVDRYYDLMANDYLSGNDYSNLLNKFVNKKGSRYASDPLYEKKLRGQINTIRSFLNPPSKKSNPVISFNPFKIGEAEAAEPVQDRLGVIPNLFPAPKAETVEPKKGVIPNLFPEAPNTHHPIVKKTNFFSGITVSKSTPLFANLEETKIGAYQPGKKTPIMKAKQWLIGETGKPERLIAKAQNIYAISKTNDIPLETVRKRYQELARNEEVTGIHGLKAETAPALAKELIHFGMTPAAVAGILSHPVGAIAGIATFTGLDKLIPTEKFIPSNWNDDIKSTIELVDFIGKAAITGGIFKKAPAIIENLTKSKLTEFNLPRTIKLTAEQIKDIRTTEKLTTAEEVSLYAELGLTGAQNRIALSKGIDINIPAEKIVKIVDRPYWEKIKSVFRVAPAQPKITTFRAGKPGLAPAGLLPILPTTPVMPPISTPTPITPPALARIPIEPTITPPIMPLAPVSGKNIWLHGTNKKFNVFKVETTGDLGKGIYLTKEPGAAEMFAARKKYAGGGKANIITVEVNISKPLVLGVGEDGIIAQKIYDSGTSINQTGGEIERFAKSKGYDSVIREGAQQEMVVFEKKALNIVEHVSPDRIYSEQMMKRLEQPTATPAQIPIEPSVALVAPAITPEAAPVSLPPLVPKSPKPKITIETIQPDQFGKTPLSREIAAMQDRIEKVKTLEASLEEVENMRTSFAHRIQRYESMGIGGKFLKEELTGIPSYYITREAGIKPDEAIEEMREIGINVSDEVGMKDFLINLESQRKALIAEIKETKPHIVTERGKETTFLTDKIKTFIQGQKEGKIRAIQQAKQAQKAKITAMKEKFQSAKLVAKEKFKYFKSKIQRRRQWLNLVQENYELTDAEFIQAKVNRNYATMTNFEFHNYLNDIEMRAAQIAEHKEAMNALHDHIASKELKIDNLRIAMKLPALKDMTIEQIRKMDDVLESFQKGDIFLSVRELETIDRTELAGMKTFREVKQQLSKEIGVSVENLDIIKVSEFDRFRWDTPLAQKNDFFRMLVEKTAEKEMLKTAEYLKIKKETLTLANKIKTTFGQKFIPQYKNIMKFIESPPKERENIHLSPEEQDLAAYIIMEFEKARDYLIQIAAMKTGRENYFTHIHRGILEAIKEEGITPAGINKVISEFIQQHKMQEQSFDILDRQTGEILAFDKFFRFSLRRTGAITPTENVVKAFLSYMQIFKRKQAFDEITPLLEIYTKSLTPPGVTKYGLLLHGNLMRFFKEWMNTKRGRHISLIAKQGGQIERGLNAARMFTAIMDLGVNFSVQFATEIGEQITTYQLLGKKRFLLGKARYFTKQGQSITRRYDNFIGENPWKELVEPAKSIDERLMEGMFIMFRDSTVRANKTFLLGLLTDKEFQNGEISPQRLTALRTELGRYRIVEGAKSVFGATPEGGMYTQYKTWALPILQTTLNNLKNVSVRITNPHVSWRTKKQSFAELYRLLELTGLVLIVYNMIPEEQKEDSSFSGRFLQKAYRELNTLIGGLSPKLFFYAGRVPAFIENLGENLYLLLTLEKYKTQGREDELKGLTGLKRQFTPVAVKQFHEKPKPKTAFNKPVFTGRFKSPKFQGKFKGRF